MNKISVVINTYNAEQYLERVLESVKDFDEIVICDMESTDSTIDIANKYGCKIVTFKKKEYNICEPARNYAIKAATHEYVLVVDADEVVPKALRIFLIELIKKKNCPEGLYIPRKNYFMGKFMHCLYPDYILRFFKREKVYWPPTIHSIPKIDGRIDKIAKSRIELAFEHLDDKSIKDRVSKMNEYTDNEYERKKDKHYGIWACIHRPFFRFFKTYILKGGFLEGRRGFIYAMFYGYYQFIAMTKIVERRYRNDKK